MNIMGTLLNIKTNNHYLELRNQAFTINKNISKYHKNKVLAAIIDINIAAGNYATLVCAADGSTNIYYSSGGGVIGSAHNLQQICLSFLDSSSQVIDNMEIATNFDLPNEEGSHKIYLITNDAIYQSQINISDNSSLNQVTKFLFLHYVNIFQILTENIPQTNVT